MIVAHEPLASALKAVAGHTFAEAASRIVAIDVAATDDLEVVSRAIGSALQERVPCLILCDALGATPCNAAQRWVREDQVQVLAGVNVPMLWRALCYEDEALVQRTQRALNGAIDGSVVVSSSAVANAKKERSDCQ